MYRKVARVVTGWALVFFFPGEKGETWRSRQKAGYWQGGWETLNPKSAAPNRKIPFELIKTPNVLNPGSKGYSDHTNP